MKPTKKLAPSNRHERVVELLQRCLAALIQKEMRDPRLAGMVTISEVSLSRDFRNATVYFTLLSKHITADTPMPLEGAHPTEKILNAAGPYLRTLLASAIDMRVVPRLHFVYDRSVEHGARLSQLIQGSG